MTLFLFAFLAAFVVPFWKILPTYGIARPWALLALFPIGTLALLYIIAFVAPARRSPG
ncbi:MAG: hypothetical protein AAF689_18450 [Pseudomonadota bacterium]